MATGQDTTTGGDGRGRASGQANPRDDAQKIKQSVAETAQEARQIGKERLEQGKESAAQQVEQLAGAVDSAAQQLREQSPTLASYASELSATINRLSEQLRNRSVDEIASDVQALARRNPGMFLLGSVAVGLALSRFLKASPEREHGIGTDDSDGARLDPDAPYTPPVGSAAGVPYTDTYPRA